MLHCVDMVLPLTIFFLSTYLFKKAAGTLALTRINIISITYYLFMMQSFIGVMLAHWGFREHYTFNYLINADQSLLAAYYAVIFTAAALPLLICFFLKLYRILPKKDYSAFISKNTSSAGERPIFFVLAGIGLISLILLLLLLFKIGHIPIITLFTSNNSEWLATERIRIGNTKIINQYVTNIGILLTVPLVAYLSFAFACVTRKKKWVVFALIFFIASAVVKTYNFEKSPIVFHLVVYFLILLYFKGGISWRAVGIGLGGASFLLFLFYLPAVGETQSTGEIIRSMINRIFLTQVGTLSYNFDLFPEYIPYLKGRSASPTLMGFFGLDPETHIRSARLLMEFYGSVHVYEGTAGVMNSLFIGEAYANYGWIGVVFSIVWVGFIISSFYAIMLKTKKTALSISFCAIFAVSIPKAIQGGFFDFIYNSAWLYTVLFFAALLIASKYYTHFAAKDKGSKTLASTSRSHKTSKRIP